MPSMPKPVYVFSGFLDSGKTSAIKNTLNDPRFNEGEKTLICAFEQGDIEYDDEFLRKSNSVIEYLDFKNLTPDIMKALDKRHNPERIFIELNGMDNDADFFKKGMIAGWEIAQLLVTIDGSTFKNYMTNMKQFMYNHVKYAEVAVINRSDDIDLRYLRNNLKGINRQLQTVFEDSNGNVTNKLQESLFDTTKPLNISDDDFGLWYMDALENARKYDKSVIDINAYYYDADNRYSNVGFFGRQAMVCCANDIQTIAFAVVGVPIEKLKKETYYHIHGNIHVIEDEDGRDVCVIYSEDIKEQEEPKEKLVNFN